MQVITTIVLTSGSASKPMCSSICATSVADSIYCQYDSCDQLLTPPNHLTKTLEFAFRLGEGATIQGIHQQGLVQATPYSGTVLFRFSSGRSAKTFRVSRQCQQPSPPTTCGPLLSSTFGAPLRSGGSSVCRFFCVSRNVANAEAKLLLTL